MPGALGQRRHILPAPQRAGVRGRFGLPRVEHRSGPSIRARAPGPRRARFHALFAQRLRHPRQAQGGCATLRPTHPCGLSEQADTPMKFTVVSRGPRTVVSLGRDARGRRTRQRRPALLRRHRRPGKIIVNCERSLGDAESMEGSCRSQYASDVCADVPVESNFMRQRQGDPLWEIPQAPQQKRLRIDSCCLHG